MVITLVDLLTLSLCSAPYSPTESAYFLTNYGHYGLAYHSQPECMVIWRFAASRRWPPSEPGVPAQDAAVDVPTLAPEHAMYFYPPRTKRRSSTGGRWNSGLGSNDKEKLKARRASQAAGVGLEAEGDQMSRNESFLGHRLFPTIETSAEGKEEASTFVEEEKSLPSLLASP